MSGDDFLETEEEMIQRLKIIFVLGIFLIFPHSIVIIYFESSDLL